MLAFTQRAAAREIEKVLRSAVANAEANHGLIGDELLVSAAYVDEGPTIKRWRATRARPRRPDQKRTCHITVKLARQRETRRPAPRTKPAARREAEGRGAARRRRRPGRPAEADGREAAHGAEKKKTEEARA